MDILHGYELFQRESDRRRLTVVDVETLSVPTPVALAVGPVSLTDLHPPLGAPAVVAEEITQTARKDRKFQTLVQCTRAARD